MQSFAKEHRANTLELIFLTNLTSLQIVIGKWLALLAESALFVIALMPYVLLRYFLGGVNLTSSFLSLFILFAISALLIAGAISGGAGRRGKASPLFFILMFALALTVGAKREEMWSAVENGGH